MMLRKSRRKTSCSTSLKVSVCPAGATLSSVHDIRYSKLAALITISVICSQVARVSVAWGGVGELSPREHGRSTMPNLAILQLQHAHERHNGRSLAVV